MSNILDKLKKSEKFCIMPWIHCATQTNGAVQLCCVATPITELNLNDMTWEEIWNSPEYKDVRLKMLAEQEVSYCTNCYKEEAAGIKSHRQNENEVWANNWSPIKLHELRKIVDDTNEDGSLDSGIVSVDFRLGNTCNLQCIMCRPHDSSKWLRDSKILATNLTTDAKWDWKHKSEIVIEQFEWYKNQAFWDSFYESATDIKDLIFGGGEPLLIKQHKALIRHLVKIDHAKNVEIRYHTNATIVDEELLELWTHFKKCHIMLSLDAYGDLNSYIRYPSKWDEIEKHLRIYDNTTGGDIIIDINTTIQACNINWMPEFAEWIWAQDYKKIGIMPDALRNYLLRLGWSHKDKEIFTKQESIDLFDLNGVGKSPSKLDMSRILSINETYIKTINEKDLFKLFKEYVSKYKKPFDDSKEAILIKCVGFLKNKAKTLEDIFNNAQYIINDEVKIVEEDQKLLDDQSKLIIKDFVSEFEKLTLLNKEILENELNELIARGLEITESWITDAELEENPSLVKTMRVKPPMGQGKVRLVRIGTETDEVDLQPCGGTHVKNTLEIGKIRLGKVENKGKSNRRVHLHLDT